MKRTIIFIVLLMLPAFVMAQNTKKVAVMETKVNDGVTSFQSNMVRGGMEVAVANASGFEAYDRTSFDAILREQNFQRSGAVNESQIKKLGEMAGVQYVVVPEAFAEGSDFYIIVKMLDVETGKFGAAQDKLCGISASEIKKACAEIGVRLFGGSSTNTGSYSAQRPGSVSQGAATLTFTVGGVSFEMIKVEAGSFIMGCTSEQSDDCYSHERPYHRVTISQDYYIGKFEVTQELYEAVMGTNPSSWKGFDHPVENVNWNDAMAFCAELSRLTGRRFTLPSEAEWEYAARGGKKTTNSKHCGGNRLFDLAWYKDNSGGHTHPVGQLNANELGIYDMNGNVWEWCYDAYGSYNSNPQTDPIRDSGSSCRVLRGGGWHSSISNCRTASRSYASYYRHSCKEPDSWSKDHGYTSWDDHDGDWGFRVVLH